MQIIQDYRALHAIPELGNTLPKTRSYIRYCLKNLNCRIFSPIPGSICAYFDFCKDKTRAFRADMDALPIQETTSLSWKSIHHGKMHACGHDGHTAILLELARRIHRCKTLPYNILLIFQPAEETTGGAKELCDCGIFQQFGVESIYALHLWPELEKGQFFSKPGILMSSCTGIDVHFTGKGGHIANCQPGCDALNACCSFYNRTNNIALPKSTLLKFGKLSGGSAENILCQKAELAGCLRTLNEEDGRKVRTTLTNLCWQTSKQTGCKGEIFYRQGYPAVCNNTQLWHRIQKKCPVRVLDRAFWTGEDFSYYQQKIPGVYFLLGIGDTPPLHSSEFFFDENILQNGVDFWWELIHI